MTIIIDKQRGIEASDALLSSYRTVGIHGYKGMPEDIKPDTLKKGGAGHTVFLALTCSIDYQRNADALWESARRTFADPSVNYLFSPEEIAKTSLTKLMRDMDKYKLSKKHKKDAWIWKSIGTTFYKKWNSDPRNFLADCSYDAPTVLARLKKDAHEYRGRQAPDFPYLRGDKIGPMWIRMLRDNAGISKLKRLSRIPIPVDIHIARATLSLGIVKGHGCCSSEQLYNLVREAWNRIYAGSALNQKSEVQLDVDEPLWHLSRDGCSNRDRDSGICSAYHKCEVSKFCVKGMVKTNKQGIWKIQT